MDQKLTLDQFAELIKKNKWHLAKIEEEIQKTQYGTCEISIEVRAGFVEKFSILSKKTHLRPKDGHPEQSEKSISAEDLLTNGFLGAKLKPN